MERKAAAVVGLKNMRRSKDRTPSHNCGRCGHKRYTLCRCLEADPKSKRTKRKANRINHVNPPRR